MITSKYNLVFEVKEDRYVLCNLLTGAVDIADKSIIEILNKIARKESYEGDIMNYLLERGYIFEKEEDEKQLLNRIFYQWRKQVKAANPYFLIVPTYYCNLGCTYCFQKKVVRKPDLLNKKLLDKIFDAVNIFSQEFHGRPHFALFGGEPLVWREGQIDTVAMILENCRNRGYVIKDIVTNGVDLEKYCDMLEKFDVYRVQVTVDGPPEIHDKRRIFPNGKGSFDSIVRGIDDALSRGIKVNIRVNVDNQNIDYLPKLADFIIEKGFCENENFSADLGLVYEYGCVGYRYCLSEVQALERIFELRRKFPQMKVLGLKPWSMVNVVLGVIREKKALTPRFAYCGANTSTFCFDLYGNIFACIDGVGMDDFKVGRFYPKLIVDQNKLKTWRRTIFDNPKCALCRYALACGGGCAFHTILAHRSLSDPVCPEAEKLLHLVFKYYYPHLADEKTIESPYDRFEYGYPPIKNNTSVKL